ncbi:MAG: hypothetical protein CMLOHMNK_00342 [Steroidobacteraceae bacterium]|nr:hypothetical protein [Steroidobacteraceae bacterium]
MSGRWRLPLFLVAAVAVLPGVLRIADHAPASAPAPAAKDAFRADAALTQLAVLLDGSLPHPAGSAANRQVADRIIAALRTAGYDPEVQEGFKCSTLAPGCSVVRNVIAVRQGRDPGRAVLVTAHYDSVPGSVAAADDGAGVATLLTIAAQLAARPPLLHDVVFLFADAEEAGLRGAMLFADAHPLMEHVAFVVNLEARGVTGPSLMFETGANNAALMAAFADAAPRPVSNSLLYEVYRRMPNSTDFAIYKRRGVSGFNFAFSRGAALYHSERDDLAHLDPASVQHQGDNALAALLRIADTPFETLTATGDATYFDIAGRWLVHWPASWNPYLAVLGLALVCVIAWRQGRAAARALAAALAASVACLVLTVLAGWLLAWPLGKWPGVHPLDHPHPWPARIALIEAALMVAFAVAGRAARHTTAGATATVAWGLVGVLALAASLTVPGMSYFFLMPLLAYGVLGAIGPRIAPIVAMVVAAYFALQHYLQLDAVASFAHAAVLMVPLLLFGLALLPPAVGYAQRQGARAPVTAGIAIVAVAALIAMIVPTHTFDRPGGVNLLYVQDDAAGTAQWQLESFGEPAREVRDALGFDGAPQRILRFGVLPADAYLKSTVSRHLPAPIVQIDEDIERDGRRIVRGEVRSRRPTWQLGLAFPADAPVLGLRVADQVVLESAATDARVVRLQGAGVEPVRFEITARPRAALTVIAFDTGAMIADPQARAMLARRPANAAPLHGGNQSIVFSRLTLATPPT